uniref:Uncharacterized protein n=1 Tax=Kalanchoe fedtschenkoi TaxID=63787 RepID=A0A7N0ZSU4_KALFE
MMKGWRFASFQVLLVLLLFHDLAFMRGEGIRDTMNKPEAGHGGEVIRGSFKAARRAIVARRGGVDLVDDFLPTTPGHSPGAGHAIRD